jgi:hypothetical protein
VGLKGLKEAFDIWSLGHVLLGFVLGLFMQSFAIAVLFIAFWEVNELFWTIEESRANSIMDITLGFISCCVAWVLKPLLLPLWPLP